MEMKSTYLLPNPVPAMIANRPKTPTTIHHHGTDEVSEFNLFTVTDRASAWMTNLRKVKTIPNTSVTDGECRLGDEGEGD